MTGTGREDTTEAGADEVTAGAGAEVVPVAVAMMETGA